jgi:hypothetical protein
VESFEFAAVQRGKLRQFRAASRRQVHAYEAPVVRNRRFSNEVRIHRPVYQSHHRVVPLLQKFPQLGNRRPTTSSESCDSQHQLMLLGGYTRIPRRAFAEAQESPQTVTELRQLAHRLRPCFLQFQCRSRNLHLLKIISRHDVLETAEYAVDNALRKSLLAILESSYAAATEAPSRKSAAAES